MSRMKKERRTLFMRVGAVLIAICMVAALALPALAADTTSDEPYSYTVRIFPGDKGTIDGKKDPIIRTVEPGYTWKGDDFDYGTRAASDTDKYYVRGIREAGRDNNTTNGLINPSFKVNRDIDIVVAYGIKGSDVEYTIHYVEYGTGKELLKARTYHGNVGDKPAVAYLYVEDYVPQYENITGTLDADASKNDWTFYYVKIDDASVSVDSKSKDKNSVTTQSTSSNSNGSGTSTGSSATSTGTSTGSGTSTASGTSTGSGTSTASGTSTGSGASTASGTSTGSGTSTASATSTGTGASTATGTSAGTSTTSSGATASSGSSGSSLNVGEGTMLASNGAVNTLQNGPVEIVDVDETETPLVEYNSADEKAAESAVESAAEENADELMNRETEGVVRAQGMSGMSKIILGVVLVLAVAAAGLFVFRRLNAGDEE